MRERKLISEASFERTDHRVMAACVFIGSALALASIGCHLAGLVGLSDIFLAAGFAVLVAMWRVSHAQRFKVRVKNGRVVESDEAGN